MTEKRECGGCTACCKTHPVKSLNKPGYTWCHKCDIGQGCTIYATRPADCAAFECQWLKGYGDECDRPDKTSVVVDLTPLPGLTVPAVSLWEVEDGHMDGYYPRKITHESMNAGLPVYLLYADGRQELYLPETRIPPPVLRERCKKNNIVLKSYYLP